MLPVLPAVNPREGTVWLTPARGEFQVQIYPGRRSKTLWSPLDSLSEFFNGNIGVMNKLWRVFAVLGVRDSNGTRAVRD